MLIFKLFSTLYSNRFTGRIPPEFGNMTSLKSLWELLVIMTSFFFFLITFGLTLWKRNLFNNSLSGTIPPEITKVQSLKTLWVAIFTFIPLENDDWTFLQRILSRNLIAGTIPDGIGALQSLDSLYDFQTVLKIFLPASPTTTTITTKIISLCTELSARIKSAEPFLKGWEKFSLLRICEVLFFLSGPCIPFLNVSSSSF